MKNIYTQQKLIKNKIYLKLISCDVVVLFSQNLLKKISEEIEGPGLASLSNIFHISTESLTHSNN